MDSTLCVILTILSLSVALNLKLTLVVLRTLQQQLAGGPPFVLPLGEKIPLLKGRSLTSRERLTFTSGHKPVVLLFLSSACPKCREKLSEIAGMLPLLDDAGLSMWFVSKEPRWRIRQFLKEQPALASITVLTSTQSIKTINPTISSPYYLFINASGELEAGGLIGDENWLSFRAQMNEVNVTSGAAA